MKFLIALILCFNTAYADNAYEMFNATTNMTNNTSIEWQQVSNVQAVCEKESQRRNLGGFKIKVDACSFWTKNMFGDSCTVVTGKRTNLEILGHEIRHCFQGAFHK